MKKNIIKLFVLMLFIQTVALCSPPLRIMAYNILAYPGTDGSLRIPYYRAVIQSALPDILVCEEVQTQAGVDQFRNDVLNVYQPGLYTSIAFHDGPDTDNMLFYKSEKVTFISASYISTALRDIAEYIVRPKWSNETLRIYAVHLKASNTAPDTTARAAECTILRNYLNQLPSGSNFIIVGDYNVYSYTDPGYRIFTANTADNDGRVKDPIPITMTGTWNNSAYALYHTQSPRVRAFGGGSTGGMDDRFDMILPSYALFDKNIIVTSSYKAYGNDGHHFNDSINQLPNTAVPDSVANGLHYASDHIPVMCDFNFPDSIAAITYSMTVKPGWNLISLPVSVYTSSKNNLFPSSTSNAFYFTGTQYAYDLSLREKVGYWLKFDSSETFSLYGKPRTADTVNVSSGWNLIGGTGIDVLTSNVITVPAGIIQTPFYGYDRRYLPLDTLKSSGGYFVRVNASGKIILH